MAKRDRAELAADRGTLDDAEVRLRSQRDRVRDRLDDIEASLDIFTGGANPTAAQTRVAVTRSLRMSVALARLNLATVRFVLALAGRAGADDRNASKE